MPKLTVEQLEDLQYTYRYLLREPSLLINAAAQKGGTIRAIYQSIVDDMAEVDKEIAALRLSQDKEGVKASASQ